MNLNFHLVDSRPQSRAFKIQTRESGVQGILESLAQDEELDL